jgi:hypothetical protein
VRARTKDWALLGGMFKVNVSIEEPSGINGRWIVGSRYPNAMTGKEKIEIEIERGFRKKVV